MLEMRRHSLARDGDYSAQRRLSSTVRLYYLSSPVVWLVESATCRLICRYCHLMLKFLTLASCVIGFAFLVPKALAEFRRSRFQHHGPVLDKPRQDIAA